MSTDPIARAVGVAIIRNSTPIPGKDDATLTMAVIAALEEYGDAILSDFGVQVLAADIVHTQLVNNRLYREEQERRASHSADVIAFPGAEWIDG
jgi:hypothetical protein